MQDTKQQPEPSESDTQSPMAEAVASGTSPDNNFAADLEKQLDEALGEAAKLKDALLRAVADS